MFCPDRASGFFTVERVYESGVGNNNTPRPRVGKLLMDSEDQSWEGLWKASAQLEAWLVAPRQVRGGFVL